MLQLNHIVKTYVLIAFVAISLVASCIMIDIITHISVMERTKEIGILRALGASKRNISQVFNAETFIIGCCAGVLDIGVSLLALLPINAIIAKVSGLTDLTARLPAQQEHLAQDQQTVPHDQPDAHGHSLKPAAHNVGHRGDRRGAQLSPFGDGHPQGGEKQADDK